MRGTFLRSGVAVIALGGNMAVVPGVAAADATDDYPVPNRMLKTSCTAEQIMAAARDADPVYYERYMIDYNNKSPDIHQAVKTVSIGSTRWITRGAERTRGNRDEHLRRAAGVQVAQLGEAVL